MILARKIDQFLKQTGESASRFGMRAAHDPNLVREIRNGRMPRPRLRARILALVEGAGA